MVATYVKVYRQIYLGHYESFSPLFIAAMVANGKLLRYSFSPLFIAAMVATESSVSWSTVELTFGLSVRFSSRQWLLSIRALDGLSVRFSSRQWLLHYLTIDDLRRFQENSFSPLFIAAMVATIARLMSTVELVKLSIRFQSAFHRGNGCYNRNHNFT